MGNKGISIIIPCYNAGEFLRECIGSILEQPFIYPFEIIIVDDGSNDIGTTSMLNNLESENAVRVIRLWQNRGAQRARNIGLKESSFDYVFTIDVDDKLNTDRVILKDGTYADRAIDILDNDIGVAFVHGPWLMFGEFNGFTISAYPVTENLIIKKHHVQTSIVYRKEDAVLAGMYNESIRKWQDWSFGIALLNGRYKEGKENKISFLDQPYYLYRIHNSSSRISTTEINEEQMIRLTIKSYPEIFKKYYLTMSEEEITREVLNNKPSKLEDLLYIASHNLPRAIEMAKQRGGELRSSIEPIGIP